MFEDGGRPLARHRAVTLQPQHQGLLSLSEEHDRELRRSVRSARLCSELDGSHVVPALRDVVVLWIGGAHMTLTGLERDDITNRSVAQSWYIEILGPGETVK